MGTTRIKATPPRSAASALFSSVQLRVLSLLFGQPDRRFQGAELIRLAGSGTGAVHRCVSELVRAGLVTVTPIGNQRHYQANRESPVFLELHALIEKTVGLADPIREALTPLRSRIQEAFVYGSIAKGSADPRSDVDLLILSDGLDYAEIFAALAPAEHQLGRKINPTISTPAEWKRKSRLRDSFAARVRGGRRIVILEPLPPPDADR